MTLHCNKVKLWPCPEWVAKMCMHEVLEVIDERITYYGLCNRYDFALERYLMWFNSDRGHDAFTKGTYEFKVYIETHNKDVKAIMNAPDLKVWME
jgi:hypothetical protein